MLNSIGEAYHRLVEISVVHFSFILVMCSPATDNLWTIVVELNSAAILAMKVEIEMGELC